MGGTSKGERRRQELVTAAAALLRSGGFDAVRHRAVAERAGLPLASTTYYFSSLEELVTAAVERTGRDELAEIRAQLDALPDGVLSTDELVELVLDQLIGPESRAGGLDAALLRYERLVGAGRRSYLAPLMRRLRDEFDGLIAEILSRAGRPRDPVAVRDLVSLVDGAVVSALIEADPDPRAAGREVLLRTLRPDGGRRPAGAEP
ncbi:TetR/AcrR family transcriptional regulator [Pseudonocardia sichuanensis]